MNGRVPQRWSQIPVRRAGRLVLLVLGLSVLGAGPLHGQSGVPEDRFHLSITLGGYFLVGVGYTHWIERHHALEFTLFPFAYPGEGFPFGLRAAYAWLPSDEVWKAKLGGNFTAIISPTESGRDRFLPLVAFTPGIQYEPESGRNFRADLWMSYYITEKVFAPSALEFIYGWKK